MARLRYGAAVSERLSTLAQPEPVPTLTLYEFEGCPFCRRVREVVTYLDLACDIVPCGRGSRHRSEVVSRGGKSQFPYLVDTASGGMELYESADIINYLLERYGNGSPLPSEDFFSPLSMATAFLPTLLRAGRGGQVSGEAVAAAPEQKLVLYNYENNQFCRLVREVLCELDLPYTMRSAGKGTRRHEAMAVATGGSTRCPHLLDPNTGASISDSAAIVDYLCDTYSQRPA
ncbi:hypothetical protein T492DRAFT_1107978 [Pavlovales sp. CCMP2436]|nr:hypothetical protein T492DRAFT_1107978 [Pavlovales sp. CCMP2436]